MHERTNEAKIHESSLGLQVLSLFPLRFGVPFSGIQLTLGLEGVVYRFMSSVRCDND